MNQFQVWHAQLVQTTITSGYMKLGKNAKKGIGSPGRSCCHISPHFCSKNPSSPGERWLRFWFVPGPALHPLPCLLLGKRKKPAAEAVFSLDIQRHGYKARVI